MIEQWKKIQCSLLGVTGSGESQEEQYRSAEQAMWSSWDSM